MTRFPSDPNPAQWGRPELVSFATDCIDGCVGGRPGAGQGSCAPTALEGIREKKIRAAIVRQTLMITGDS